MQAQPVETTTRKINPLHAGDQTDIAAHSPRSLHAIGHRRVLSGWLETTSLTSSVRKLNTIQRHHQHLQTGSVSPDTQGEVLSESLTEVLSESLTEVLSESLTEVLSESLPVQTQRDTMVGTNTRGGIFSPGTSVPTRDGTGGLGDTHANAGGASLVPAGGVGFRQRQTGTVQEYTTEAVVHHSDYRFLEVRTGDAGVQKGSSINCADDWVSAGSDVCSIGSSYVAEEMRDAVDRLREARDEASRALQEATDARGETLQARRDALEARREATEARTEAVKARAEVAQARWDTATVRSQLTQAKRQLAKTLAEVEEMHRSVLGFKTDNGNLVCYKDLEGFADPVARNMKGDELHTGFSSNGYDVDMSRDKDIYTDIGLFLPPSESDVKNNAIVVTEAQVNQSNRRVLTQQNHLKSETGILNMTPCSPTPELITKSQVLKSTLLNKPGIMKAGALLESATDIVTDAASPADPEADVKTSMAEAETATPGTKATFAQKWGDLIGRLSTLMITVVTAVNTGEAMFQSLKDEDWVKMGTFAFLLLFIHMPVAAVMVWLLLRDKMDQIKRVAAQIRATLGGCIPCSRKAGSRQGDKSAGENTDSDRGSNSENIEESLGSAPCGDVVIVSSSHPEGQGCSNKAFVGDNGT